MDDREELENLKAELQGIHQRFKNVAPSDGGLRVERGESQSKKRKLQNPDHPHKKLPDITKKRPKKHKINTVNVMVLRQQ